MVKIGLKGLAGTLALLASLSISHSAYAAFDGFGSDIPLSSAAPQIVPEGTAIHYGDGVDQNAPISFGKAADWHSALGSAVAKKGYKAEFGADGVTITKVEKAARPYSSAPVAEVAPRHRAPRPPHVEARDPRPRAARAVVDAGPVVPAQGSGGFTIRPYRIHNEAAPAATTATHETQRLEGKEIVDKKDWKPVTSGTGHFIVEEGFMLHQTLATWADAAGWTVIWNSEHDYQIEAHAEFSGDFLDASSKLVAAMKDARPTITVDFYKGNKVVVISNHSNDEVN